MKRVTVETPDIKAIKKERLCATVRNIWDASPNALDEEGVNALYSKLLSLTKVTKVQKCIDGIKR